MTLVDLIDSLKILEGHCDSQTELKVSINDNEIVISPGTDDAMTAFAVDQLKKMGWYQISELYDFYYDKNLPWRCHLDK